MMIKKIMYLLINSKGEIKMDNNLIYIIIVIFVVIS